MDANASLDGVRQILGRVSDYASHDELGPVIDRDGIGVALVAVMNRTCPLLVHYFPARQVNRPSACET